MQSAGDLQIPAPGEPLLAPLSVQELLFTSAPPKCYNVVLLEFGFLLSPALLAKSALAQRHSSTQTLRHRTHTTTRLAHSPLTTHHPPRETPLHRNSTKNLKCIQYECLGLGHSANCKLQRQQRQRRPPKTKTKSTTKTPR